MTHLILFIILTIASQILLKQTSLKNMELKTWPYLFSMVKNPRVLLAYGISGLNLFVWIIALSKISLLSAFFITSSIYVIMVFIDHLIFKEKLNVTKLLGALFISAGVILSII